jgi:hypothetical protein
VTEHCPLGAVRIRDDGRLQTTIVIAFCQFQVKDSSSGEFVMKSSNRLYHEMAISERSYEMPYISANRVR